MFGEDYVFPVSYVDVPTISDYYHAVFIFEVVVSVLHDDPRVSRPIGKPL